MKPKLENIVLLFTVCLIASVVRLVGNPSVPVVPDDGGNENRTQTRQHREAPFFSAKQKKGFTVWGIQPGDNVTELLKGLPKDVEVSSDHISAQERLIRLNNKAYGCHLIFTAEGKGEKEVVEGLSVVPVTESLIVERSGVRFLDGSSRYKNVRKLPGARADTGGFLFVDEGLSLWIEFKDTGEIRTIGLEKAKKQSSQHPYPLNRAEPTGHLVGQSNDSLLRKHQC